MKQITKAEAESFRDELARFSEFFLENGRKSISKKLMDCCNLMIIDTNAVIFEEEKKTPPRKPIVKKDRPNENS